MELLRRLIFKNRKKSGITMHKQGILIVGEQFSALCDNEHIWGYHQMEDFLNGIIGVEKKCTIFFGQGLTDMQLCNLKNKAALYPSLITTSGQMSKLKRAERSHEEIPSIISTPEKISDKIFQSYLMLDSENENQCTGSNQSIQISEMSLLKACHQLCHSVLKDQFSIQNDGFDKTFNFNPVEINFFAALYPVDVTIRLNIQRLREYQNSNFKIMGSIEIIQNETIAATLNVDFALLDKDIFTDIKKEVALISINKQMNLPVVRVC